MLLKAVALLFLDLKLVSISESSSVLNLSFICHFILFALLYSLDDYDFTDSKGVRASKNKKKNRRRKDQMKDSSSNNVNGDHKKVGLTFLSLSLSLLSIYPFFGDVLILVDLRVSSLCFRSWMESTHLAIMPRLMKFWCPPLVKLQNCRNFLLLPFHLNLSLTMEILMMS